MYNIQKSRQSFSSQNQEEVVCYSAELELHKKTKQQTNKKNPALFFSLYLGLDQIKSDYSRYLFHSGFFSEVWEIMTVPQNVLKYSWSGTAESDSWITSSACSQVVQRKANDPIYWSSSDERETLQKLRDTGPTRLDSESPGLEINPMNSIITHQQK